MSGNLERLTVPSCSTAYGELRTNAVALAMWLVILAGMTCVMQTVHWMEVSLLLALGEQWLLRYMMKPVYMFAMLVISASVIGVVLSTMLIGAACLKLLWHAASVPKWRK